jgi:translation initiation factor IF-2
MSEGRSIQLAKAAKELNVGTQSIVEHLKAKGHIVENKPSTKLTEEQHTILLRDFMQDIAIKEKAESLNIGKARKDDAEKPKEEVVERKKATLEGFKVVDKIDLSPKKKEEPKKEEEKPTEELPKIIVATGPTEKVVAPLPDTISPPVPIIKVETAPIKIEKEEIHVIKAEAEKLSGPKIMGRIELPVVTPYKRPENPAKQAEIDKHKRKRIDKKAINVQNFGSGENKAAPTGENRPPQQQNRPGGGGNFHNNNNRRGPFKKDDKKPKDSTEGVSEKEIQDKIKATMAKLSGTKTKTNKTKYRKPKSEGQGAENEEEGNILPVTEFITVSELAGLMDVTPTKVITSCMGLGIFVSINQRLDAEVIELVAGEFGFEAQFINLSDEDEDEDLEEDGPEDLLPRPPIVTIMGHVDHGKTSLLDYIRSTKVVAGEMGGITQHIGAYEVTLPDGKHITFLDTPGHEAFTAMRARGAKLTDIAVIVIAADDSVMPQTKEAISHAQAAEVPMIFAINKIDKDGANPEKIKEALSQMNILVEDWGGKFQSQELSAKKGLHVEELLEKILLEAELLDLKANPNKLAVGSVIEAMLDKGRGYVTTIMVQEGTLAIGDFVVAGQHYGKVKAMTNERGLRVEKAGPSTPVQLLGLNGAPTAGEKFKVYESEQEAKEIANRRATIMREQGIRASKHITLDEIGRRLALGSFKELKIIVKGDVDGSVEALSDSLLKLSKEEVQVSIVHKGVGQISESDVMLAAASDAIIVAFQVRPSLNARLLAEKESIDIRNYSVIYDAIEEIKAAIEGMLEPTFEEKITSNVEIREVFKISKVGTIAGCIVLDGKIERKNSIRIIREGIVIHTGEIDALKRFKDDVKDVTKGYECGIKIKGFNDLQEGDTIESFEQVEIKRK